MTDGKSAAGTDNPAQAADGDQGGSECTSPPCMLDEFEAAPAETARGPEIAPEDWQEVRRWRKVKRQLLIERRLATVAAERSLRAVAITTAIIRILEAGAHTLIGFYWPFKGEYDARPLAQSLHANGTRFALPVVVEKGKPMIFREWHPGAPMTNGIWNIPVPASGDPVLPDLLLVPLVGFDRRRYRLGYGGGYYDRTLAGFPVRPRTIGIGFEGSEVPTIYPQPHDIPMDVVVTERRTIGVWG